MQVARFRMLACSGLGRSHLQVILWIVLVAGLLSFLIVSNINVRPTSESYKTHILAAQERRDAAAVRILRLKRPAPRICSSSDDPLNYILGTGQSLSSGLYSNPAVDTSNSTWPQWTFMTNLGVRQVPDNGLLFPVNPTLISALLPIVSTSTGDGNGETIGATLTWTINDLVRKEGKNPYPVVFTTHGAIGRPYSELKKDSVPYNNALLTVSRVVQIVAPRCVIVRGMTVVHGEADSLAGTSQSQYEQDLLEWQQDYTRDLSRITGQNSPVLEFTDQMNSYTSNAMKPARATSGIPLAQLQAALDHPASVFLVTPKYFLAYTTDGVHLTASSEQRLGEYYAKAYKQTVLDGVPWKPLYPTKFRVSGNRITIAFHVPVPPLIIDRSEVLDPGNAGFVYSETSTHPPVIVAIALKSSDEISITLSHPPEAAPGKRFLSYAWEGILGKSAGPTAGPRGNLRDSDTLTGRYSGRQLYNWCVSFRAKL
jgi:hypothetical protein